MKNIPLFLAYKYLRSKKKEKFLSVTILFSLIGITLAVATLIIVTSVMNGFKYEFMSKITEFNGHVNVKSQLGIQNERRYLEVLNKNPDIEKIIISIQRNSLMSINGRFDGVIVNAYKNIFENDHNKNISENLRLKNEISHQKIVLGTYSKNAAGVGIFFAKKHHLRIGDDVTVISPETRDTAFGEVPISKTFKISYIFKSGLYNYDANVIFIPFEDASIIFDLNDKPTDIQIFLKKDPTDEKIENLKNSLSKVTINGSEYVYDWAHSNESLMHAVQVEKNVMFMILTLLILIAGFNIISSMVMLVKEKSKDIAILKTIGFKNSFVLKIFIYTGSFIGIFGTFLGSLIGILFSKNIDSIKCFLEKFLQYELFSPEIYFLLDLPCKIEIDTVCLIILMTLIISFLSSIYPAIKAARMNPIEILRFE